ncbi:MAG: hypothetical protein MK078_13760 [Crocinitomicaceae bacterium]|nr:hypothetical protein [Crocinitomicaceae bacterium]
MRRRKYILLLTLTLFIYSCQKDEIIVARQAVQGEVECGCEYTKFKEDIPSEVKNRKLYPAYNSKEALMKDFIKFINNGDRIGLENLLVSEFEFKNWVFPEYNLANPNCNISWSMIYNSLQNKSNEGLNIMLQDMNNYQYVYKGYEFTNSEQEEDFETYNFYNRTLIHVETVNGPEIIAVAGSVIEMNGTYKFLSYRENNSY